MVDKINIEIGLTGDEAIKRQLAETAASFEQATRNISSLGNTMAQALDNAAAAAKKFGASANQLAVVETKIRSINARAKDTGVSFAEMAAKFNVKNLVTNIDNAEASLASLSRAVLIVGGVLGGIGTAAAAGFAVVIKSTIGFAQAINRASAEAIKLGTSFEQFDQLRLGMEKAGVSSKAISSGLQTLQGVLDKLNLDKVKKAFEDLSQLGKTAFPGSNKLAFLVEQAKGVGPAADAAREALQRLGLVDPFKPLSESMGPVQLALKELGLTLETFSGKSLTLNELLPQIVEKLRLMPDGAARSKLAIQLLGDQLGVELIQALRTGGVAVDQFIQKMGGLTTEQENAANALQQSLNRLESAWNRFGSVTFAPTITAGINTIITALGGLQTAIDLFPTVWQSFMSAGLSALNPIYSRIQAIINLLSGLKSLIPSEPGVDVPLSPSGGNDGGGLAAGGLLGGRGTGTSDSNLAWLSRGEYVTPARAVAQPGVLSFLEALRRSGGNLSRVLNGMGHFALGGMVPRLPAYAAGGLAGGSNVTIQFPGLAPISGLRASSSVVDQLHKAAALAQVRSGGRKPSRYS